MPVLAKAGFSGGVASAAPLGRLRITFAKHDGQLVAARAALLYRGRVFDWFAGSSPEGDKLNANALLVWEMIGWGCRNGFETFDFGGAGDPNVEYGVREFKGRFQGQLVNFASRRSTPARFRVGETAYGLASVFARPVGFVLRRPVERFRQKDSCWRCPFEKEPAEVLNDSMKMIRTVQDSFSFRQLPAPDHSRCSGHDSTFRALLEKKSDILRVQTEGNEMTEQGSSSSRAVQSVLIERETDLNTEGFEEILRSLLGQTVLEVGSGRGLLAKKMSARHRVTAVDIMIDPKMRNQLPEIDWREATMERLPFEDGSFDTVVTTHTLEHVQNIFQAIQELRRVTKQRLIIVVPKQRPYAYT
jgi:hypothetical protein